jgi:hypothetical protein
MSWIKIDHTTPDKPEIHAMADILGVAPEMVLGCLFRIWMWADLQGIDGTSRSCHGRSVTKAGLDSIGRLKGLTEALIDVGWIIEADNELMFHNFNRHNGLEAKERALNSRRKAKSRISNVTEMSRSERDKSETKAGQDIPPSSPLTPPFPLTTPIPPIIPPTTLLIPFKAPFENSQPMKKHDEAVKLHLPTIQHEALREAFALWAESRRQMKKPLTELAIKTQLVRLAKFSIDEQLEALNTATANGTQGVFPRKTSGTGWAVKRPIETRMDNSADKYSDAGVVTKKGEVFK